MVNAVLKLILLFASPFIIKQFTSKVCTAELLFLALQI